jgi:hypothetical protein
MHEYIPVNRENILDVLDELQVFLREAEARAGVYAAVIPSATRLIEALRTLAMRESWHHASIG